MSQPTENPSSVRFKRDLLARLNQYAIAQKMPRNRIVNDAVESYLASAQTKNPIGD